MPRTLRIGESVNGYAATKLLNTGMMAWAFSAKSPTGEKVFLKQYKSPSVAVDWYRGYVKYQKELKKRIEGGPVRKFCVKLLDQFEAKVGPLTFFQVFEFVEGGHDLGKILDRIRTNPSSITWEQRLIWSRVFMAGINQLHEAKVVHGDLKPPNVQFLEDKTIRAGWQPKLIDMDFSILADVRAPWHGKSAYVGSPRYFSPEHLQGEIPQPASDLFTCGLILYQLLADSHPYGSVDDDAAYLAQAKKHSAPKPKLIGSLREGDAATIALVECLHRCLNPVLRDRPTAREVNLALNGRTVADVPEPPKPEIRPPDGKEHHKKTDPLAPSTIGRLKLMNGSGAPLEISITTRIGKALLRGFGSEAEFTDTEQFVLEKRDDVWFIAPVLTARNYTLVNGSRLETAEQLRDGDMIALGSHTTAKTALPLTVKLVS